MDPIIGPIILLIVGLAGGAAAGAGVATGISGVQHAKQTTAALEAQTESLEVLAKGQVDLVNQATKPIVIDAEIRDQLSGIPVQCLTSMGGDPQSALCLLATCWQYGQSSANRPECEDVKDAAVEFLKAPACPEALPEVPE